MKYKVGDKVKGASWRNGEVCTVIEVKPSGWDYKVEYDDGETNEFDEDGLELATPTLEDMPEGTVIINTSGIEPRQEREVILVFRPGIYLLDGGGYVWTAEELKDDYEIKDQDIEEVTMEQVCKKFGKDVKIKKGDK